MRSGGRIASLAARFPSWLEPVDDRAAHVCGCILSSKRRTSRREQLLTEIDQVIPCVTVEALVEPRYPKMRRAPLLAAHRDYAPHLLPPAEVRSVGPASGRLGLRFEIGAPIRFCTMRAWRDHDLQVPPLDGGSSAHDTDVQHSEFTAQGAAAAKEIGTIVNTTIIEAPSSTKNVV